jgi:2-oxoglutarate dehydrogenase E2 component (dihydrolipoamide succinyltransferase)
MSTDVVMPQMGESVAEGTITKWLKRVGDRVKRDEPLFEISTDKVDAEIPAPIDGVLSEVLHGEGQTVAVNSIVARIDAAAQAGGGAQGVAPPAEKAPAKPAPATPPANAAPAAPPQPAQPARPAAQAPAPARTPPPAAPSPAPSPRPSAPAPAPRPAPAPAGPAVATAPPRETATREDLLKTRSTPIVRRIAAEHGIDLEGLPGTGIAGRVTKQDILSYIERGGAAPAPAAPGAPAGGEAPAAAPATPAYRPGEQVVIEPMSVMRQRIAEHMVMSKRTSAHVTTVFEMDMTAVDALRQKHKDRFQAENGVKLSITAFVARAVVDALRAYPIFNASVDGKNIVYKKNVNLGIAVALDWGLIVPVVKTAEEKNLIGLARSISDLALRAREKKLSPDDVQGGTFTITNPGVYGSLFGTPIINQPQVAILGVGAVVKRPVVVTGPDGSDAIAIRSMAFMGISYDHRLLDGAMADHFMNHVKKTLESAAFPELEN